MILVTGATGFLGKRVCRLLEQQERSFSRTSLSLGTDLRDKAATLALFETVRPTHVLNCAAFVGGIQFGLKHPVQLFQDNLCIMQNLLEAAHVGGIARLVNPISNCAYPARASLFKESEFWDGPLHESVMVYGFVRKAFWIGSWAYAKQYDMDILNIVLSNMYGPEDHFEEERSHALGALVMKFVQAKRRGDPFVSVWGSGKPVREWMHVDDGAQAMVRSLAVPRTLEPVNIGIGEGISILDMAKLIRSAVGYEGDIRLDPTKEDGAPYKTVDGSKGAVLFGWRPEIPFHSGVRDTVIWYKNNISQRD